MWSSATGLRLPITYTSTAPGSPSSWRCTPASRSSTPWSWAGCRTSSTSCVRPSSTLVCLLLQSLSLVVGVFGTYGRFFSQFCWSFSLNVLLTRHPNSYQVKKVVWLSSNRDPAAHTGRVDILVDVRKGHFTSVVHESSQVRGAHMTTPHVLNLCDVEMMMTCRRSRANESSPPFIWCPGKEQPMHNRRNSINHTRT